MTQLLIIKPSSLGDIVHGLQVATSLKAQCEGLRISWVVRDIFAPIVRASTAVDQVYIFERNSGAKGFLRLTKELRKTKFDYVFDFQGLLRSGLITSRMHAPRKVGRSDAREMAGIFYNEQVPLPPDGKRSHALDILLQFCPVLGAKAELRETLKFREVDSLNLRFADARGGGHGFLSCRSRGEGHGGRAVGVEEGLFVDPVLGDGERARAGRDLGAQRNQLVDGCRRNVLELIGDDVRVVGEFPQRRRIVIGADQALHGHAARGRVGVAFQHHGVEAQLRGRLGQHAAQLAAAQDADGRSRREGKFPAQASSTDSGMLAV